MDKAGCFEALQKAWSINWGRVGIRGQWHLDSIDIRWRICSAQLDGVKVAFHRQRLFV
jgi:hypothetical protein